MKISQLLVVVATFSSFTTAWPWPPFAREGGYDLVRRQNNPPSSNSGALTVQTTQNSASQSQSSATQNSGTSSASGSGTASQTQSNSGSATGSGASTITATSATATASISPQAPAGGLSMVQPAVSSGTQYYCSGSPVTFVWQYTDLVIQPTAIDVIATIASTAGGFPSSTYTLASNQSFAKTQTVIWDTAKSISGGQLPVAMYTLVVYDAANPSGVSAVPSAGYLGAAQYAFGMYTHRPLETAYPTPQQVCVTCNAAGGRMEFMAGGLFFTIVGGTMASFLLLL